MLGKSAKTVSRVFMEKRVYTGHTSCS